MAIATPSPAATATPSPSPEAVTSVEEAIAAVVAVEPRFQGFGPLDLDVIGQANHVRGSETARGFELTFVAGSGDCPAGCINHHYTKFLVGRDGSVVMLCEWAEGEAPQGTPC